MIEYYRSMAPFLYFFKMQPSEYLDLPEEAIAGFGSWMDEYLQMKQQRRG